MHKIFATLFVLGLLAAAPFAQAASADKIGLVDAQAVLAQSKAGQAAQAQMKAYADAQSAALKKQEAKLKKEQAAIEKNASIETDAAQKAAQEQFQKDVQAYQQDGQKRQQAFTKKRAELLQPLQAKLYEAIQDYAVRHGYEMILEKSAAIYSKDSMDLTADILKAFNAAAAAPAASGSGTK